MLTHCDRGGLGSERPQIVLRNKCTAPDTLVWHMAILHQSGISPETATLRHKSMYCYFSQTVSKVVVIFKPYKQ